jgi:hypothetical protein
VLKETLVDRSDIAARLEGQQLMVYDGHVWAVVIYRDPLSGYSHS